MRVLIRFGHGLGDAVQLTSVLLHLRQYRPTWTVDVASLPGKHSALHGVCNRSLILGTEDAGAYERVFRLNWHEADTAYRDWPSTKAERCLIEQFDLTPDPRLCRYQVAVGKEADGRAAECLASIAAVAGDGRFNTVILHYQGNTLQADKDLPHEAAEAVCREVRKAGFVPVILDWDSRSPLPDGRGIFCPDSRYPLWGGTGTGDAEMIAALIARSSLFVGIDSGPQKVAAATTTPAVGVWTRHHPIHYCTYAPHMTHLVPANHANFIRGDRDAGAECFGSYRHEVYEDLEASLAAKVRCELERIEKRMGEAAERAQLMHQGSR